MQDVPPGTLNIYAANAQPKTALVQSETFGAQILGIEVTPNSTNDIGTKELKKTGFIKGVVNFFNNPNDLELIGSDVFVPGTGFISKTDKSGNFLLFGIPEGTYQLRFQHTGFSPFDSAEIFVVSEATTDLGEILLSIAKGPEGSINVTNAKIIDISGTQTKVSESRKVNASIAYDSDAALMKVSDEPAFLNKEWKAVSKTAEWSFNSDGQKSLYVKFSDLNGLESSPYSVDFIVDTEKPEMISVSILNGWIRSASRNVYTDVSGSDSGTGIASIMFSTLSAEFPNANWVAYNQSHRFNIDLGSGINKTVFVKTKDHVGRVSNVVKDEIEVGSETIIAGGIYSKAVVLDVVRQPFKIFANTTSCYN